MVDVLNKVIQGADTCAGVDGPTQAHCSAVSEMTCRADRPSGASSRALPDADRSVLERWVRSRSASFRLVLRSRIVLLLGRGLSNAAVARTLDTTTRTVRLWWERYRAAGPEGLRREAPGRGRRPGLSLETVGTIVERTTHPTDGRRPTAREVARTVGTSAASVCRVWASHGIQPAHGRKEMAGGDADHPPAGRDDRAVRCETEAVAGCAGPMADQLLRNL